jgi:hypothetical protein
MKQQRFALVSFQNCEFSLQANELQMLRTQYRWLLLQNSNYTKCSHSKKASSLQTTEDVTELENNSEASGLPTDTSVLEI